VAEGIEKIFMRSKQYFTPKTRLRRKWNVSKIWLNHFG